MFSDHRERKAGACFTHLKSGLDIGTCILHCVACAGAGCDTCAQNGCSGRTGVFELLVVDDEIHSQIHNQSAEANIRATALAHRMRLMRDDGRRLVDEGITSEEELLRVTRGLGAGPKSRLI